MKINLPSHDEFIKEVNSKGFSIINNCVPKDFVSSQRSSWIPRFIKKKCRKEICKR